MSGCIIDGCGGRIVGWNLCKKHYDAEYRRSAPKCRRCRNKAASRSNPYCRKHMRKSHGHPRESCVFCESPAVSLGLCYKHYRQRDYLIRGGRQQESYGRRMDGLIRFLGGRCVKCGIDDRNVLQLHHRNNDGAACRAAGRSCRWYMAHHEEAIADGLELLCANCHMIESRTMGYNKKKGREMTAFETRLTAFVPRHRR